jgi:acyl-CoA synthetase (AMP-forming)/AMP-acid ligase II
MNAYTVKNAITTLCKWNAGKTLIVDGDTRYSGERLDRESRAFAHALLDIGIARGDTVALVGTASCAFYAAFFAVHKLGAVSCNIHVRESAEFIALTLARIEARLVTCSPAILPTVSAAVERLPAPIPILVLDQHNHPAADNCYGAIVQHYPAVEPHADIAPGDDAIIILSSGSTGTPKGIVHSQENFVRWLRGANALFGAVSRNTRFLVNVGTSFAAWPFSSVPILYAGGTIVLMEGFTTEGFCRAVEREKITMAGPVPTMIRMLEPAITQKYDLSSFEMVLCAGEPPTLADIERVLGWADTDIRCLYLASESAPCAATYWELGDYQQHGKPVCAGKPVPGADLRIVNPEGGIDDERPCGEPGEILLRGPTLAKGYWRNPELTAQRFIDGWWRSGDIGHLDEDGYLTVAGRTDNTINTGGIKVHGEEVETCLLAHPDIAQVAVIGCPDPKWGQRIEAHVATRARLTGETLAEFCEQQGLAAFKRPKRYIFHESLPVGVTGKLDRVTLREKYSEPAGFGKLSL